MRGGPCSSCPRTRCWGADRGDVVRRAVRHVGRAGAGGGPPNSAWRGPRGIRLHRTEVNPAEVIEFDGDRVRRLRGRRPRHDAAPDGLGDRHPGVPGRSRRTARRDGPGRSRGRRLARPTRAWRTRRWGRSASRRSCHSSTGASPASSRGSPGPSAHRCSRADRRPSFRYRRLGRQPQLSVPKAGGRPT
jgi:hypothetical protein